MNIKIWIGNWNFVPAYDKINLSLNYFKMIFLHVYVKKVR